MFTYKKDNLKVPVKVWMKEENYYKDVGMIEQVENTAQLPFAFHHVALCPDGHLGFGAPIGGILATKDVIVPNFVGKDIGCGMCAVKTSLTEIDTDTLKKIMGEIRKVVPVGFKKHREKQDKLLLPKPNIGGEDRLRINEYPVDNEYLICSQERDNALKSLGTLGGGNHFIEIQKGSDGHIWIMIHSGSRNLGLKIANYYNKLAVKLNERWHSSVPKQWELAHLPIDSEEGQAYLREMSYAVDFALANRKLMMKRIIGVFKELQVKLVGWNGYLGFDDPINIAHNYASIENHCSTCIDNQGSDNLIVESLLDDESVSKVQDFLNGYRPFFHSCGGLLLKKGVSFLKISPLQVDALERMSRVFHSLDQELEPKHNHFSSLHLCECGSSSQTDKALNTSENRFGLGFAHLFGVEKDYRKWDRILGRIFLGYEAYNLDCKLVKYTSIISQKHSPTQVWVHRKGATLANENTIGIIPGNQGSKSYIVKGLGNPDSFNSCSHGAGRLMSRTKAKKELSLEKEIKILNDQGIIHGIRNEGDLDEAPSAYKNIKEIMENQKDLVKIEVELNPLAVIKG